jgi:chitinase
MNKFPRPVLIHLLFLTCSFSAFAQTKPRQPAVIAYYAGRPTLIDSFDVGKLTHIIFSFGHL